VPTKNPTASKPADLQKVSAVLKFSGQLILGVLMLFVGGCQTTSNGSKEPYQVVLLDVQGMWGGRDLWIAENGKASVRFVNPPGPGEKGLQEARYEFDVPPRTRAKLERLVIRHRFFAMTTDQRSGIPDEAHPRIYMKSGTNEYAVAKWESDKHSDFDPIYRLLLKIAESGINGRKTYSEAYRWDFSWKPDGFPLFETIRELTKQGESPKAGTGW
jgi:hypothetical protein